MPVVAVRVIERTVLVNPGSSAAPVGGVGLSARVSSHDQRWIWIGRWPGSVSGRCRRMRRWCGWRLKSDPG
jgi:hypothetical protein